MMKDASLFLFLYCFLYGEQSFSETAENTFLDTHKMRISWTGGGGRMKVCYGPIFLLRRCLHASSWSEALRGTKSSECTGHGKVPMWPPTPVSPWCGSSVVGSSQHVLSLSSAAKRSDVVTTTTTLTTVIDVGPADCIGSSSFNWPFQSYDRLVVVRTSSKTSSRTSVTSVWSRMIAVDNWCWRVVDVLVDIGEHSTSHAAASSVAFAQQFLREFQQRYFITCSVFSFYPPYVSMAWY